MVYVGRATTSRIYNCYLGGTDNYPSDRIAVGRIDELAPMTEEVIDGGRRFLLDTVRYLVRHHGIRQIVEFGCGLPYGGTVHRVAQGARRAARVVYVDHDPIVIAHGRMLLEENNQTRVIDVDLRAGAGEVFARAWQTEDGEKTACHRPQLPTAALLCGILDELDDNAAARLVGDIKAHLAPGSYIVVSHLTSRDPLIRREATALMNEITAGRWGRVRSPEHVASFLDGLQLTEPLRDVATWYSGQPVDTIPPDGWFAYGGIARTP